MIEQADTLPGGTEAREGAAGISAGRAAAGLEHLRSLRLHHVAAAWGTGAALHLAPLGPGLDGLAAGAGTAACTASVLAGRWGKLSAWGRVHAGTASACATAWASYAAAHGPLGPVNAAALLGAGALALPWWLKRAPGWLDHETAPELPEADWDETPSRIQDMYDIWRDFVACDNGPLPGTALENPEETADAISADIALRRGAQVTSQALTKWEYVASAFDLPETQVLMEPHQQGRKNRARLTILDRDALADRHEWGRSTLDMTTGIARGGTFFDGQAMHLRFFMPGSGATHWLIAGTTGSGKSTGLFGVLAETTDPANPVPIVNVLIDPEEGAQSLPLWIGKLRHAYTGEEKAIRALRGMEALMNQRAQEMSAEGLDHFTPSFARPQVNVIIEESSVLMKESRYKTEAVEIITRLGKRGRKRGIGVILVALVPSLEDLDSQTLRSMLRSGNVWCFRTGDSVSAGMLGLDVDPSRLPETFADGSPSYGVCYIKGPDGRQAMARSLDIPPHRKAEIVAAAAECPLDASSLAAFERGFSPPKQEAPAAPGQPAAVPAAAAPANFEQAARLRGTAAHAVLAFLADEDGDRSKADCIVGIRSTGITSPSTVGNALRMLVDQGLVHTAGDKCPYRITDAGRSWLAANPAQAA